MGMTPAGPWRWQHVLRASWRLGFAAAMVVMVMSAGWWAWLQVGARLGLSLPQALPTALAHGTVMVFGFTPLFFAGFLFTTGARWLKCEPPPTRILLGPVAAQVLGWLLWLAGAHLNARLAVAGALCAAAGLAAVTLRFLRMVGASTERDRLHAVVIGAGLGIGSGCLAGTALALASGEPALARLFVLAGFWGCVAVVFFTAAHRMVPFFDTEALPSARAVPSNAVLAAWLVVASIEIAAVWLDTPRAPPGWRVALAVTEMIAGGLLLVLATAWARAGGRRGRLLVMMHAALVWLGLGLLLTGAMRTFAAAGHSILPLAGLHALGMGWLGSMMLAMVSRVSTAHGGQPFVVDAWLWNLFRALQVAVVLRIAATLPVPFAAAAMATASLLWMGIIVLWSSRHLGQYGRVRPAHPRG